jgi:hypothetical protein
MKIRAEKYKIDSAVIDLIGREFRFDHAKGLAEWIKNSVDAYTVEGTPDEDQEIVVIISLNQKKKIQKIEVLDFVGMTKKKIDDAFKIWFDPKASKLDGDGKEKEVKTLGGHGNGGKFYMREMFETSELLTYRNGKINGFGFDSEKKYGAGEDFDDSYVTLEKALEMSELKVYDAVIQQFHGRLQTNRRFSVVRGINPRRAGKTNYLTGLIDKLVSHSQTRRIISRKKVYLYFPSNKRIQLLAGPQVKPKRGFEKEFQFICPEYLEYEGNEIHMYEKEPIRLKLLTSEEPLKGSNFKGMNSIDFLGEVGVIASYEIEQLGYFKASNFSEFLYGECSANAMEDKYVRNDREKFVEDGVTRALIAWVRSKVEEICVMMDNEQKKNRKTLDLEKSSDYNTLLNKWKNRFLEKILKAALGGLGDHGIDGGFSDDLNFSTLHKDTRSSDRRKTTGSKGGSKEKRANNFPEVLLSGKDTDPFSPDGRSFECAPRHPAIYQRPIDRQNGIYWINTSKEYANLILNSAGVESSRWKDYLFNRYMEIIVNEVVDRLGKQELELTGATVTNEISTTISNMMDAAVEDLNQFLFGD